MRQRSPGPASHPPSANALSPEPGGIYLRFWLWTAAVAALVLFYALRVAPVLRIDTDIMALLPGAADQTAAAQQRHSDALGRKLLFLVGDADPQRARQAARQLADRLRDAHVFTAVSLEADAGAADLALYREHRFGLLSDAQRRLLSQAGRRRAPARANTRRTVWTRCHAAGIAGGAGPLQPARGLFGAAGGRHWAPCARTTAC